ncbi:MAG: hypothetical protein ACLQPH_06440 [Acidimicrobiales bacterium]
MGPEPGERTIRRTLVPPPVVMTALAFGIVAVPFAVALVRFLLAPGQHLSLPDDLALIDLHTRSALRWQQQLGVFDRNNWNHPGPAYFYLLSLSYRTLGSGARAMFFGATSINAAAALGCVGVVRRRAGPARALWAAVWVCVLAIVLAAVGPGTMTYSEGPLGAVVSPWNPLVVIFPLLLLLLLCAAAIDRSTLALVWAVVIGSFVVQTNISTLPLVAASLALAAVVWLLSCLVPLVRRRTAGTVAPGSPATPATPAAPRTGWVGWALGALGIVAFVAMWIPPLVQQFTNHPGNLGLIERYFRHAGPGQGLTASLSSVSAAFAVLVHGPAEVMSSILGSAPRHAASAVAVAVAVVFVGAAVTVVALRQGLRFAAGTGALTVVGCAATLLAATRIVGLIYGYLVVWAVVIPVVALIGIGMLRLPARSGRHRRPASSGAPARMALCAVAVVVGAAFVVRVAEIPALAAVSDPQVGRLSALVTPRLVPQGSVFVGDNDAGGATDGLLDTERFIGLVNQLDQRGDHPTVNQLWKVQFGPGYLSTGREDRRIQLSTWTAASLALPGYVGRVGDIAVTVTDADGRPAAGP